MRKALALLLTMLFLLSAVVFPSAHSQASDVASFKIIMNPNPAVGVTFGIWIFAKDTQGNDLKTYTGSVHLTISYSGGTISRTTGNFKGGQWWEEVTLNTVGIATVSVDDGYGHTGGGTLNVMPLPTPTPTPTSKPTPTPLPTLNPESTILWRTNVTWDLSGTPARNLSSFEISGEERAWTTPAVAGNTVFAAATEGVGLSANSHVSIRWAEVYAFNAVDGAQVWKYYVGWSDYISNVAFGDGKVYFSAGVYGSYYAWTGDFVSGNHVYALDAVTGQLLWLTNFGGSDPVFVEGKVFLNNGYSVVALDAHNGQLVWNYTTKGDVLAPVTVAEGVVYSGSRDGNVYAFNKETGEKKWNCDTGGAIYDAVAVEGNSVFVSSSVGYFYAIDAKTGGIFWSYATQPNHSVMAPAVSNGVVYFVFPYLPNANSKGYTWVYALDAHSGAKIWNITLGNWGSGGRSTPIVYEGTIYLETDRSIIGLRPNNGLVVWNYTGSEISGSTDLIIADGTIYLGANYHGQIYAYKIPVSLTVKSSADNFPFYVFLAVAVGASVCVGIVLYFRKHRRYKPV